MCVRMSVTLHGLESPHTTASAVREVGWRLSTAVYKTGSDPGTGALALVSAQYVTLACQITNLRLDCTFACIVTVLVR